MGNDCLSESLAVLDELGCRPVVPAYDEYTDKEGWHAAADVTA